MMMEWWSDGSDEVVKWYVSGMMVEWWIKEVKGRRLSRTKKWWKSGMVKSNKKSRNIINIIIILIIIFIISLSLLLLLLLLLLLTLTSSRGFVNVTADGFFGQHELETVGGERKNGWIDEEIMIE